MWLSRQIKPAVPTADADLGMTTITGDSVGVVTRGEVRALPVYGPGGYVWMPESDPGWDGPWGGVPLHPRGKQRVSAKRRLHPAGGGYPDPGESDGER